MGRKMKNIIALLAVLVLIYYQQSSFVSASDRLGGCYIEPCSGEQNPDEGKEENEEVDDGLPDEEEPESGGDEDNEEEKEIIECFQCQIPPEDGRNGYYVCKPEVEICHVSKIGTTKYSFTDGNGYVERGELDQDVSVVRFEKERFQEGENRLQIWMEDEAGTQVEEYAAEKVFLIDTQAPSIKIQTPRGTDAWYQKEVFISVSGEEGERGSQVEEISCSLGNRQIGESKKESAGFRITFASADGNAVPVTVSVRDRAGNYAEETFGLYIDNHPPQTVIEGIEDYMITSRPVEISYKAEDDNRISHMTAGAKREDPQGQVSLQEVSQWDTTSTKGSAGQILTDDGIYQLYVEARDEAGYESRSAGQVIIDSENPVISHVDETDGKYLQSFCWDYPIEEVIKDFTSYTYSVNLDGKPYHAGDRVTREGGHVLEVNAVDSAGNTGAARAEFVVDHTAPTVVFTNIEEGKVYEEERAFQIGLEKQEDSVEEIRVNGELQKLSQKNQKYELQVKECRDYEILVKACDKAGNQTVSRIHFTIGEKKTLFHRLADPIKRALTGSEKSGQKKTTAENGEWKKGKRNYGIVFVLTGMAAGGIWFTIKKQLWNSL